MVVSVRGHRAAQTQSRSPRAEGPRPSPNAAQPNPSSSQIFFFPLTLKEVMLNGCGWCLRGPDCDRVGLKVQIT